MGHGLRDHSVSLAVVCGLVWFESLDLLLGKEEHITQSGAYGGINIWAGDESPFLSAAFLTLTKGGICEVDRAAKTQRSFTGMAGGC